MRILGEATLNLFDSFLAGLLMFAGLTGCRASPADYTEDRARKW
jgi:hypothetical protein